MKQMFKVFILDIQYKENANTVTVLLLQLHNT